jgi:hypothetical protein
MLFFPVFAYPKPRSATHQSQPSLPAPSPFLPSLHSSLFFSEDCALFSATAVSQPFAYQSFPHSFHRDGGCTPSRYISDLATHRSHSRSFFSCTYKLQIFYLLSFDIHASDGGCRGTPYLPTFKPANLPTLPDLSPFFSHSSELFCTVQKSNSFLFKQFRTLSQKHPGVGGAATLHETNSKFSPGARISVPQCLSGNPFFFVPSLPPAFGGRIISHEHGRRHRHGQN